MPPYNINKIVSWFDHHANEKASKSTTNPHTTDVFTAKKIALEPDATKSADFDSFIHELILDNGDYFISRGMVFIYESRADIRANFELISRSFFLWYHYHALNEYTQLRNIPRYVADMFNYIERDSSGRHTIKNGTALDMLKTVRPDIGSKTNYMCDADILEWSVNFGASEHFIISHILEITGAKK